MTTDEIVEEILQCVNQPVINEVCNLVDQREMVKAVTVLRDGESHWMTEDMALKFVLHVAELNKSSTK